MRALLISTYELGHQPLNLASPAGHLIAAGIDVDCLDLSVQELDEEKVRAAGFVGISVPMHTAMRLGVRAAQKVRDLNPRCHLCFYGLYASLNSDYLLNGCADSVIGGEFEEPLTRLVRSQAGLGTGALDGISTKGFAREPFLGKRTFVEPARHLLPPLSHYARLDPGGGALKLAGYVEASRGCAHRCRHCPITPVYSGRLRIVSQDVVLRDITTLVELGAEHITFGDPDFLNGVKHSMRIVQALKRHFPALSFDVTVKVEHILEHRDRIRELSELGCLFVVSAIESVDDDVLRYLDKGHDRADIVEAIQIMQEANLALRPTLVAFTPWTTLEGYLQTLEFIEEHDMVSNVDPVQYSIRLLLPKGSWLARIREIQPHIRELQPVNFAFRWEHPDPRVDELQRHVCGVVEAAVKADEDQFATFQKVKNLAVETLLGTTASVMPVSSRRRRVPGLTESWFC